MMQNPGCNKPKKELRWSAGLLRCIRVSIRTEITDARHGTDSGGD
jgi:hypothetical protein